MNGCLGKYEEGSERENYVVYSGTGRSGCIKPGLPEPGSKCQYYTDGGAHTEDCHQEMDFGAFNVGWGSSCDFGEKYCSGHSLTQYEDGACHDAAEYSGEISFQCINSELLGLGQ